MSVPMGDVFIGGGLGYTEHIKSDGTFVAMIHETDKFGNDAEVWGQTIRGTTGDRYSALGVKDTDGTENTPHDITWCPDDTGFFVAIVPSSGLLKLYKYNIAATAVIGGPWTLATEAAWTSEPVKLDVACDSVTVYYTMQGKLIKAYNTSTSTQLPDFETLAPSSPYIFGDLKILNDRRVSVAMTDTGAGPRRGVAVTSDPVYGTVVWIDEVNPVADYHVYKRKLVDGTAILSVATQVTAGVNGPTFSICSYYKRCTRARTFGIIVG